MVVLETYFPNWRDLSIHESSPSDRGTSQRLAKECPGYVPSQYFLDKPLGMTVNGVRCENLECLTFRDEQFDLCVTQDVLEHVFDPAAVFREIARTLKPGGAHVFTAPLVNKTKPTQVRARKNLEGVIDHLQPPIYHGNPIGDQRSLATMDWGFDICKFIFDATGLFTQIFYIDDPQKGIRAEFIEVLVTFKP